MIAQVIPIVKLPVKANYFDYLIPEELSKTLKSGCLVTISFRNRDVLGLVYAIVDSSSFKNLKPIKKIEQIDFVKPYQIKLIPWFSEYYHVSWSSLLKNFFPSKLKRKIKFNNYTPPKLFLAQTNIELKKIPLKRKLYVNKGVNLVLVENFFQNIDVIKQLIKRSDNLVCFFPTVESLSSAYFNFDERTRENITVVTGELNKSQYWKIWQDVLLEKTKIIFTTRRGIFLPFSSKSTFLISQSENINHKQSDLTPRYSVINVVLKITELNKGKAVLTSYFPKIEHYTQAKLSRWSLLNWQKPISNLVFIDLNSVQYQFSPLINENLLSKLQKRKRILMYLNRKGDFTVYKCRDCHYIAYCKNCHNPLKYYQQANKLKCHYCGLIEPVPVYCPHCGGVDLKGLGSGVKNIEKIIKQQFKSYEILRLDSDFDKSKIELNNDFIILGTDFILNKLDNINFDQLIFLNSDLDLLAYDFRSLENFLQKYTNLIRITATNTIIQTYKLDHPAWDYLKNDYSYFWKQEIKNRKKYGYPPYFKLVKLIYADLDKNKVEKNIKKLYLDLLKLDDFQISTPQRPIPFKQHRKYYMYILVKYKKNINSLLKNLPEDVIVDHDPEMI